jgi:hypothetical protein
MTASVGRSAQQTKEERGIMRAEIEAVAGDIRASLALLRRHL